MNFTRFPLTEAPAYTNSGRFVRSTVLELRWELRFRRKRPDTVVFLSVARLRPMQHYSIYRRVNDNDKKKTNSSVYWLYTLFDPPLVFRNRFVSSLFPWPLKNIASSRPNYRHGFRRWKRGKKRFIIRRNIYIYIHYDC